MKQSIAILEFDAPESCHLCPLSYMDWVTWCVKTMRVVDEYDKERAPDCPLRIVNERLFFTVAGKFHETGGGAE